MQEQQQKGGEQVLGQEELGMELNEELAGELNVLEGHCEQAEGEQEQ